ncbi:MAG: chromosomal replication initiator protein DnaA [Neisseriaceae bacterium]|nr:MAG: chromosomal replication initiator protein DnaA [Neisseriaceae bacterium]
MNQIEEIWQLCLNYINDAEIVTEKEFNTWLKTLKTQVNDGILEIVAANALVYDFVNKKYWHKIEKLLPEFFGDAPVKFVVSNDKPKIDLSKNTSITTSTNTLDIKPAVKPSPKSDNTVDISKMKALNTAAKTTPTERQSREQMHNSTKLTKEHTFETFVRGNSNQLAVAIGMHVTQDLGNKNHNPLFIYGNVGLGKTHLMQAIGNEVHRKNPQAKIRYLHANDYIQDVVKASQSHGFDAFKKYYNGLDLLLMDDIQFIAGDKTKSQEEFFYTFNNLLEKGKQIIMTCDTYPKNINLNDRLTSRFSSGLTVEIQPPELEMRVAILKNKALRSAKLELDDEVAFFIAQNIKSNVRELEGALNKVIYHAKFSKIGLTIGVAKEALMELIAGESRIISIDDIQKTVCDYYKIKLSELLSKKRTQNITRPRQIAMSIAKELTQMSLPSIGANFGGRDHATVIHAQKTVAALRESDERVDRDYKLLLQMLQN